MNSDFEKRLKQQSMRPLPPEWRAEILQTANAAAASTTAAVEPRNFLATLNERLSALLWPCPKAWAGLATVWIAIAALNLSVSEPALEVAKGNKQSPVQWIMALREHERLLDEMNDDAQSAPVDRPRKPMPGRSQRPPRSIAV